MAMTLQGTSSMLSNTSRVPTLESDANCPSGVYMNENSNGYSGVCQSDGLSSVEQVQEPDQEQQSDEPVIDITINNVVCSFSVKSHLNLKQIAQNGFNVEYRRENGVRPILGREIDHVLMNSFNIFLRW